MHQPARFPEIFDQILQNTPVLEFGSRHPPQMKNPNFLSWIQIWAYPEHLPPKKWKTKFLSWVQIWAYPEHPTTPTPTPHMWLKYVETVSPRIPSSCHDWA